MTFCQFRGGHKFSPDLAAHIKLSYDHPPQFRAGFSPVSPLHPEGGWLDWQRCCSHSPLYTAPLLTRQLGICIACNPQLVPGQATILAGPGGYNLGRPTIVAGPLPPPTKPVPPYPLPGMKKYVIVRDIPSIGSMNAAELSSISAASCKALGETGHGLVQWQHSYVTGDKWVPHGQAEATHE